MNLLIFVKGTQKMLKATNLKKFLTGSLNIVSLSLLFFSYLLFVIS